MYKKIHLKERDCKKGIRVKSRVCEEGPIQEENCIHLEFSKRSEYSGIILPDFNPWDQVWFFAV